jgi:hypothetical protein
MSCTKTYFSDEKQALFYIDKLRKTSVRNDVPIRAYLCPKCLLWHLTSKEPTFTINQSDHEKEILIYKNQIIELKKKNEELSETIRRKNFEINKLVKKHENIS